MESLAQDDERVAFWRRHTVSGIVPCEGRPGGDEFALLLPGTDLAEATVIAERLVTHVRTTAAPYAATVSVGAATVTWSDPVGLQATADAAVYRAKRSGRTWVCVPPAASAGPRSVPLAPSGR